MKIRKFTTNIFVAVLTVMTLTFSAMTAAAQTTVVPVTQSNQQGFDRTTQNGGKVRFISDPAALDGGALQLTTTDSNESYAGYTKETSTPLSEIDQLSYRQKTNSGPAFAAANFAVGLVTGTDESTFLIFEPYYQPQNAGTVPQGVFQEYDVLNGLVYSTETVTCSNGFIIEGSEPGGPGFTEESGTFYTLNQLKTSCPDAVVDLFGVFIGTFNPNYDVEVDFINFDGTIYDFRSDGTNMGPKPETKEQCKEGGFRNFGFKNQGQCIASVNASEKRKINR